ncbi:MAG TPA: CRISPR-associated endonuclease Cas2 [Candidatus Sumerlaeota bacterium]|nr:CRISPR-associated endonuclease Cas2 [Candidatus Sumerlaeota bacterium]
MTLLLITYDVNTETPEGKKRLRHVAKACENRGQRVQNSVFECLLDPAQIVQLRAELENIINPQTDSLRFYFLGSNWKRHVDHVGAKPSYDPQGTLIV